LFADGVTVGQFTDPAFSWMVTAQGSGSNPLVSQLRFTSLHEANYTVSNVWIGTAQDFFESTARERGDFNADGVVNAADFVVWRDGLGTTFSATDYEAWRAHFGQSTAAATHIVTVPEPACMALIAAGATTMAGWLSGSRHHVRNRESSVGFRNHNNRHNETACDVMRF
jgi:hypothetical protein